MTTPIDGAWGIADRLWHQGAWATDVQTFAWFEDGAHLFVSTGGVCGSSTLYQLNLLERKAYRLTATAPNHSLDILSVGPKVIRYRMRHDETDATRESQARVWRSSPPGEQFTRPVGLALVEAKVEDAQRAFGPAPVSGSGHHEQSLCYHAQASKTLLVFTFGMEGTSASFAMRRFTDPPPTECPAIQMGAKRVARSISGLGLGISEKRFRSIVGKVRTLPDGRLVAEFARVEAPEVGRDPLDVAVGVEGRFVSGRLVDLVIWKTIST